MKTTIMNFIKNNTEWIWRVLVFLMLSASLYLNNNYITKIEYKNDQAAISLQTRDYQSQNAKEHTDMAKSLVLINQTLVLMNNITDRLSDHETRIRVVEQRQINVMARLEAIELKTK